MFGFFLLVFKMIGFASNSKIPPLRCDIFLPNFFTEKKRERERKRKDGGLLFFFVLFPPGGRHG